MKHPDHIKLPEQFTVTLTGTVTLARRRVILAPGALGYLLERLLSGQEIACDALEGFGIVVEVG